MAYLFHVNKHHEELIWRAIKILCSLGAPISTNITFRYLPKTVLRTAGRFSFPYGYDKRTTIEMSERLVDDDAFVATAIHELLHSFPPCTKDTHRGEWKKWASFVSEKTDYSIRKHIYRGGFNDYWSHLGIKEKRDRIRRLLWQPELLNQRELEMGLAFASEDEERKLVLNGIFHLKMEYPLTWALNDPIGEYKDLRKEIAYMWLNDDLDTFITTPEESINFESLFALSEFYLEVKRRRIATFGDH